MNLNNLKDLIELSKAIDGEPSSSGVLGRKVIVRSRDAGVIYGEYAGNDGSTIRIKNGVQMWKWFAAKGISLIDVATFGVKKSDCKFSVATADVAVFNACAMIDVTNDAAASIEAVLK